MVNLRPKVPAQDGQVRTGRKNLRQAQLFSRLGYFPGGIDRVGGEKTNDRQTCEPSAVLEVSPPFFVRWYFIIQAGCRTEVPRSLSDVAIAEESPGSSPHRD